MYKKISIAIVLIAILCYPSLLFLPWWVNLVIAFIVTYPIKLKPVQAFVTGGVGVSLCWAVVAIWADMGNAHVLSSKMAILFHLPKYWMIIGVTILAGFITGALGGITASFMNVKLNKVAPVK